MTFSKKIKENLKPTYRSNNLEEIFYKPLLSQAISYKRVSAYFSSSGLNLYTKGLDMLFRNGGRVKFVISANISKEDFKKIKSGYEIRNKISSLSKMLNVNPSTLKNNLLEKENKNKLGNLAFMIANGKVEIKFAFIPKSLGIFHDKFGIIDSGNEKVFFNGSVNETQSGIKNNYESISVDCSWDDSKNVKDRINENVSRFDRIWHNKEKRLIVKDATDVVYDEIAVFQNNSNIEIKEKAINKKAKDENFENNNVVFSINKNGRVIRTDNSLIKITSHDRKLRLRNSDLSSFFENDNSTLKEKITYKEIQRVIKITKQRCSKKNINVIVRQSVKDKIAKNKYSIRQYKIIGNLLKSNSDRFYKIEGNDYKKFSKIVQNEVSRKLKPIHLKSSFYEYKMARSANFSVPGSGKTAMILGVFAYLNSNISPNEFVDKILVVCPINAFESWKAEFNNVFGDKKNLSCIDNQSSKDFNSELNIKWNTSNLILINYESVDSYKDTLERLINKKTMLVFDEVHRIKNPNGKNAKSSLYISEKPLFKFVMTGTPIPNSYEDIYNFLHILYGSEYNSFFGWDSSQLKSPSIRMIDEINQKLKPFFWRTNKNDLGVPKAENDKLILVNPSKSQLDLAKSIYYNEKSSLAKIIRLIQASTNPKLLLKKINYEDMGFNNDGDFSDINKDNFDNAIEKKDNPFQIRDAKKYRDFNLDKIKSPKFEKGISLVKKLVKENKKVIIWATYVETMKKIKKRLINEGINTNLVYGDTDIKSREVLIDEFKNKNVNVMVSNPQTLGESVSMHKTVHNAVYFEYNFNLTFMLQSRDRIHRLGLKKNQYTRYYYLMTKSQSYESTEPGYIDQKIYEKLKEKEKRMYESIDNNKLSLDYSDDEIKQAISIIDKERERIENNRNE